MLRAILLAIPVDLLLRWMLLLLTLLRLLVMLRKVVHGWRRHLLALCVGDRVGVVMLTMVGLRLTRHGVLWCS